MDENWSCRRLKYVALSVPVQCWNVRAIKVFIPSHIPKRLYEFSEMLAIC